jgi:predicted Zn-dependent protease
VYTARAGRNPLGIAKYFARAKASGVPEWLSSHPTSTNRVKDVTDQVEASASYRALAADSATTNYKDRFDSATAVLR